MTDVTGGRGGSPDPVTPDRWQEIEKLFHAAQSRPSQVRAGFLAEACPDEAIRREVEALLAQESDGVLVTGGALPGINDDGLASGPSLDRSQSLMPGSRIGVYEIAEPLGVGGMGEVYRGRDTRLGRDVAIKMLRRSFTGDPDRLIRFEREARALAACSHPSIATIYGIEESVPSTGTEAPVKALVMELVEGETLAERIARGPLSVRDSCRIATEIAAALGEAHEKGIIHRDLKPANIKFALDDSVKVLDFGLAKLLDTPGAAPAAGSPAIPADATREGVTFGTAAYMSPEQARGERVDRRTDIWAFGCVFYEMLTGRRAFSAASIPETLTDVLRAEPDWSRLPGELTPVVRAFLVRCLQKDANGRPHDIRDVRLALEGAFDVGAMPLQTPRASILKRALPFVATAAATLVVAFGLLRTSTTPPPTVTRLALDQPNGLPVGLMTNGPVLALSPDGTHAVFRAMHDGFGVLMSRPLDTAGASLLYAGNFSFMPFFSPDGQWVGFNDQDDNTLKRVPLGGGPAEAVAPVDANGLRGASWGVDDVIVFGTANPSGLWQVEANGGTAVPLTALNPARGELNHVWPERLPGGDGVLFTIQHDVLDRAADEIAVADFQGGAPRVLVKGGAYPKYAASGHLLYGLNGTLRATPFDEHTQMVRGSAVDVVEGVATHPDGGMELALATNGTLMYAAGVSAVPQTRQLLGSVDREGRWQALDMPMGRYANPRVSPDGHWLVFEREMGGVADAWLYDLSGSVAPRQLTEGGNNRFPVWSRDGAHVVFQSDRDGNRAIWWQRADGTGRAQQLTAPEPDTTHVPEDVSPTHDWLAFDVVTADSVELWLLDLRDRTTRRIDNVESTLLFKAFFSPDGRWLAFTERHTDGSVRTFVQAVPPAVGRYPLGTAAEMIHHPLWSPAGDRLFYFPAASSLVSVSVSTDPTPEFGSPVRLPGNGLPINVRPDLLLNHDITPDGSRIIAVFNADYLQQDRVVRPRILVVQNWLTELERLVPLD